MNTPKDPSPAMSEIKAPEGMELFSPTENQVAREEWRWAPKNQMVHDWGKLPPGWTIGPIAIEDFIFARPLPASAPAGTSCGVIPTPRTDAEEFTYGPAGNEESGVSSFFARALERKLQASDARAARLEEQVQRLEGVEVSRDDLFHQRRELWEERDALQAALRSAETQTALAIAATDAANRAKDIAQQSEARLRTALEAHQRLREGNYLPWHNAGGPDECKHGYADGIPCPHCDVKTIEALAAQPEAGA